MSAPDRVLVLGLGASGLAMARWFARAGADVVAWDSRADAPGRAVLAGEHPAVALLDRPLAAADAEGVARILRSPGLAPHDARLAPVLAEAERRGIAVEGELDVFADGLADLARAIDRPATVVAVTGTNGKTTTTALTAAAIARTGRSVEVAGNIGPTLLERLTAVLDGGPAEALAERAPDVWVLELSSFQLHGVARFEADAAALLNLTEDHLDWHGGMEAYAVAKARVFGRRTVAVVNRDDPATLAALAARDAPPPAPAGTGLGKAAAARAAKAAHARRVVRFGTGVPERVGDFGLAVQHDVAWLVRARGEGDDDAPPTGRRAARADAPPPVASLQQLMPADALRIRGRHNAANALAALALGTAIGCPLGPMLRALADYAGEPHRVQHVATVDGVDAFDDSKGTNVGATLAALEGLGAERAPAKLVVLLGGDGKGQDFAPLAPALARHARAAVTLGRDAPLLEAACEAAGVPFERAATLDAAVDAAFARAEPGDAVLLSPACASLDMFRGYEHRAEVFVGAVRRHAADAAATEEAAA
jgi:UDP-N-acetylmuramoylalanine--D-glutamate ligase